MSLAVNNYPDNRTETNTYDAGGNKVGSTDRQGRTTSYSYDTLNRFTQTALPNGATSGISYDAAGRIPEERSNEWDAIPEMDYGVLRSGLGAVLVIGSTGKMALMRTIDPATFVEFKLWLAEKSQERPDIKRRRVLLQAKIVQSL